MRRAGALALVAALLAGCALIKLNAEADAFYASTVLVGRAECAAACAGPLRVWARRVAPGPEAVVHQVLLHEAGGYELIVPAGNYVVFAFADRNGNGAPDGGEPSGAHGQSQPIVAGSGGVVSGLDITLDAGGPRAGSAVPEAAAPQHSTQAGALADLDAPEFAAARGVRGYWAPMEFFRAQGGNIYFLEPYDPRKVPVLFVHGAAGSARDWRYFVEHLDRQRFQPWLFQYPSGSAVDSMAYLLYWKLLNLHLRYRFEHLVVTAHSMGGLVVRDFLVNHGNQFPQIGLFVSLSTPWGGEDAATLGVKHSPAVVPSWRDMQPEGPFIKALFARPLPPQVRHVLFFGHRGGPGLLRPNNDGTVTLASQLHAAAQSEASRVFGFDEDHTSILDSQQVFAQYAALLESEANGSGASSATPRWGRVRVATDFEGDAAPAPKGTPLLLLVPAGASAHAANVSPLSLLLNAADAVRELGPIGPGEYDAYLVMPGFASVPPAQRLRVTAGASSELAFGLRPQGTLGGYIAADAGPFEVPAGSFQRPHPTVRLRSVVLRGAGEQRVLEPRSASLVELLQRYARGEDGAAGANFLFVGLAAGEYELEIEAEGYRTYRAMRQVTPGRSDAAFAVVLQRLPWSR